MQWKLRISLGLAVAILGSGVVRAQLPAALQPVNSAQTSPAPVAGRAILGQPVATNTALGAPAAGVPTAPITSPVGTSAPLPVPQGMLRAQTPNGGALSQGDGPSIPSNDLSPQGEPTETRAPFLEYSEGRAEEPPPYGPTPLRDVLILQKLLFGDDVKDSKVRIHGWLDADYTYRSTGHGITGIAPVENRFGDEALLREIGLFITRPLDAKELSWGYNIIFFGGSDAAFISPTAGGWKNTNPRFGSQFTDLNLTAHLPIFTEGGVDIKAGRQTTVLGPMGALSWQRPFNSSDYAWYNMEEGRYTGISANWIINKQLSWYNGAEIGGWGEFFNNASHSVDYITQVVYWLDKDAKKTKVWTTILTGPTGFYSPGNSTTFELGLLHNWSKRFWQIIDTQNNYSRAPIFFPAPPGYQQRAYDVYTYLGYHLNQKVDINARFEWYKDVDGGGYPGGFGIPHTNYFETTWGINYHPTRWLEFRPEVRYDHATNPAFGVNRNFENQLSVSADMLIKF